MKLDNFEQNENNRFAVITLKVLIEKPCLYNPIYLYYKNKEEGEKLLKAFFDDVSDSDNNSMHQLSYIKAESLNKYDMHNQDLLIISDVQEIEENVGLENKIIEYINEFTKQNKQIIVSGNKEANDLKVSLLLKSKLQSGLIIRI